MKESFWIVAGQGAAVLGALIGIRILTELMSPEQYGQLALGMTLATLAGQAWLGPLGAGTARFFAPASEAGELRSYTKGISHLIGFVNRLVLLLVGVIVIVSMLNAYTKYLSLIIAALVFATVSGYNNMANGIQNAARQRSIVALHSGILPWARLSIAVTLIILFGVSSAAVIWGYVFATIVILFSQYYFFRPVLQVGYGQFGAADDTSDAWKRRIIEYSWPFATWGIFSAFHLASDRWALAAFTSEADVGLFSVLFQLGYFPMAIVTEMLVALISPILFQRAGDATSQQRLDNAIQLNIKVMGIVLLVTAIIFSLTWWMHEFFFNIFVANAYAKVSYLLPWLTLSAGIVAAGHVLSLGRMSGLDTRSLIIPKVVTAIIGVMLNISAAFLYGLEGIVLAQLVFSMIYFVWMFIQYLNYSQKVAQ